MPRTKQTEINTVSVNGDGDFHYDGDIGFYLMLVGDDRRYQRVDAKRLYSQVTRSSNEKDESVGYYKAQLRLYGLEAKRTRPEMKKLLLAAFGEKRTLEVPKELRDLEEKLKETCESHEEEGQDVAPKTTSARKRKAPGAPSSSVKKKAKPSEGGKELSAHDIEGPFTINSKALEKKWDATPGNLKIYLAVSPGTGKHLWGEFEFGLLKGYIRGGPPPKNIGDTLTFNWRGREREEGRMLYMWTNEGTLTFLDGGKISGTIKGGRSTKEFTFSGAHDEPPAGRPIKWGAHVDRWKGKWRGINERTESAAQKARTGLWSRNTGYKERPAQSDTTSDDDSEDPELSDDGY